MSKSHIKVNRFVIIMQVILQIFLLLPWIDVPTGKCNTIIFAIKSLASGNMDASYSNGQDTGILAVYLLFQIIMLLLIQIISLINLVVTVWKKHVKILDIVCVACGVILWVITTNGLIFDNMMSNIYPHIIILLLFIQFLGVRLGEAWRAANEKYYEDKERARELKWERKRRLAFSGKYARLFYRVLWKNFLANKKDYVILCVSGVLSTGLIFAGIGMSELLSPLNHGGNIIRGQGIHAILLNFLVVSIIFSIFLIVSVVLSYFRNRSKNYGIFVNLGLRKRTLNKLLGLELASSVVFTAVGGIIVGNLILLLVRGILRRFSDIGNELGNISVISYLATVLLILLIFVISLAVIHECFMGIDTERSRFQAVKKEKIPGRFRAVFFSIGILIVIFAIYKFSFRRNSEGIYLLVILFIGLYLVIKNGWCMFLMHRKHKTIKKYYSKLVQHNTFYYRYKTTVRYLFFIGIVPIAVLFLFSKEMISSQIAQKPESLFPYDFMLMATEEDDTFFEEMREKYDVEIQSYPMVRVSNVDNTEFPDNYKLPMMPQGQHIGVSETTYRQMSEAVGSPVEKLHLSEDGSDIFIVYQQDTSVKAHPIDYLFAQSVPFIHIGQPVENYSIYDREDRFPKRKVAGEKIGILTGAYRRGGNENIVVFSDSYFTKIVDSWKTTNWQSGESIGSEGAVEDVTTHHWPTKLTLMNVDDSVYNNVEKELQTFKEKHAFDEKFDGEVLSYYSSRTQIKKIQGDRLMTQIVNMLIICALQLVSLFIIYLKFESELEEKRKRRDFLSCIGMRYKERVQVLKTEVKVYLWMPLLMAVMTVPLLTKIIWVLRQYTKEDCLRYSKIWAVLVLAYILLQMAGVKLIETYIIRKVEGRNEGNRKGK